MSLESLVEKFEATLEDFKKQARAEFELCVADLFKSHPELMVIKWEQFTPYFNDGDECIFRVGETVFITEKFFETREETLEDILSDTTYTLEDHLYDDDVSDTGIYTSYTLESKRSKFAKDMKAFESVIQSELIENVLKTMFDDHAMVSIYRDDKGKVKTRSETYEHD